MNSPNIHKTRQKKHAGHPSTASAQSPTALSIALIRSSAIGLGCSLGIALLFLLSAAFAIHRTADPVALVYPLSHTALYVTALLYGIFTVRIYGGSPWLCGAISGAMLLLLCLLLGAFLPAAEAPRSTYALWTRLPVLPLAVIGAHLAKKRRASSHRRRK